jgi:hypothetical protein
MKSLWLGFRICALNAKRWKIQALKKMMPVIAARENRAETVINAWRFLKLELG